MQRFIGAGGRAPNPTNRQLKRKPNKKARGERERERVSKVGFLKRQKRCALYRGNESEKGVIREIQGSVVTHSRERENSI